MSRLGTPWDFEPQIDCDEVLEYVKNNKEWFLDQLGESDYPYKRKMIELSQVIHRLCNEDWDFLRRVRDGTSNLSDREIVEKCKDLYSKVEEFGEYFGSYAKEEY